jgi:hypothetical protein
MKLITIPHELTAAAASKPGRDGVMSALEAASARTGADFDYLLKTAARESSLDPQAKAATSSATGLFQFIEQTWLGALKKYGPDYGLGAYADAIERSADGRYRIAQGADRQEILALRKDPQASALMAGAMTMDQAQGLSQALGRPVSQGETYAAHVMGPGGALKLIQAAERDPAASAAALFPAAAAANRSIFYAKDGSARSVTQVLANLSAKHSSAPLAPEPARAASHEHAAPAGALGLRGAQDPGPQAGAGGWTAAAPQAYVLSPVMVQLLDSLERQETLAPGPEERRKERAA